MSNIAIKVENLSKRYRIGVREERHETLTGAVTDIATRPFKNFRRLTRLSRFSKNGHYAEDIIWAVKHVSFEVKKGEVLGIIGSNGAGKSTLLKILSRITQPTEGYARINGRVGSLLEVGTGFHSELTGRENVYLNGTILGMTRREIARKFDEIVDFSGVEKFIDTPVKRYSSGMKVRLAFAVAAHLEPEILIVDEVLAVGDAEFQRRCLGKMQAVATGGRTVLFVSHNMGAINQLCHSALLLENGEMQMRGDATEVVEAYLSKVTDNAGAVCEFEADPSKSLQITRISVCDGEGHTQESFNTNESIHIAFNCECRQALVNSHVWLILRRNGLDLFTSYDTDDNPHLLDKRESGSSEYGVTIPGGLFKAGMYTVSVGTGVFNDHYIESLQDAVNFQIENRQEINLFRGYAEHRPGFLGRTATWTHLAGD